MTDYTPLVVGIKSLIMMPVAVIVNGWILQVAARKTVNCFLPFGRACLISFAVGVAYVLLRVLQLLLNLTVMTWLGVPHSVLSFVFIIVGFFVGSAVYGAMVKPRHLALPVGFRKGMLVWLVVSVINLAILAALAVVLGGLFAILFYSHRH